MALVQVCASLALEGTARVTVSEVAARAQHEYRVEVQPWEAGQHLSALGVSSASSHGRSRLVLEPDQLNLLQRDLAQRVVELEPQVARVVQGFAQTAQRMAGLEEQYQRAQDLARR